MEERRSKTSQSQDASAPDTQRQNGRSVSLAHTWSDTGGRGATEPFTLPTSTLPSYYPTAHRPLASSGL